MNRSPGRKRGAARIAALLVFGAVLLGGALLWRFAVRSTLATYAETAVRYWTEDMVRKRDAALAPTPARSDELTLAHDIKAVRLWNAQGRLLASRGAEPGNPPPDAEKLARVLAGETLVDVGAWAGGSPGTRALAPVRGADGLLVAELFLDQAPATAHIAGALGLAMAFGGGIVFLALAGPGLLLFRLRERRRTEDRVRYLAEHDALTGLSNRSQFTDQLAHILDRAADAAPGGAAPVGAVLLVNVDRFRAINESYGYAAGDAVLRAVAERLRSIAGPDDVVARLAVDEFALLTGAHVEAPAVRALAERVAAALGRPHRLSGRSVAATVSLGVALFPRDGCEPEPLLRNAGLALDLAKSEGGDTIRFFEGELAEATRRRRRLEHDLRIALATDALEVHYQPQFDLATGALKGCEALARWRHPALGVVPPGEFIPIAEETGLISLLGEWVLRRACLDASRWPVPVKVAVNLSPAQFRKGAITPVVQGVLAETGLPAGRLELEITESLLLADTEATLDELRRLRDIGITVAMDDFGTGYSSLSSLSRFPFSKIKIDKSFVQHLTDDPGIETIVKAIVSLGRALHVTITAEGVESEDQAALLRRIGCHEAQGYLYGRPMPAGEFAARLAQPDSEPASAAAQVA